MRTRGMRSSSRAPIRLRWSVAAAALAAAVGIATETLHIAAGAPPHPAAWFLISLALVPVAFVASGWWGSQQTASAAVTQAVGALAITAVTALSYLVLVVGIHGRPHGSERGVLLSSLAAALVAGVFIPPVRRRALEFTRMKVDTDLPSTAQVVTSFGARMSRAVPLDELLLQLAEGLREAVPGSRAEIWTGTADALTRTVSVPTLPRDQLCLPAPTDLTVSRARIGGPTWVSVWLPQLAPDVPAGDYRVVPIAHLGELLGLIAVYRPVGSGEFTDGDEDSLVEVARQLGLALHNVRLDSALQASLDELAQRNKELQASRLRIVNAADASRREIERNLHDGAQQHLVALAVKLGLARQLAEGGDIESTLSLLEQLRTEAQVTVQELRELAHGIYPPLLRDRGLEEALRAAAARSVLPCTVSVELPGRYSEQVETAAYFCCLEAMQNAGKYAGDAAQVAVRIEATQAQLIFEVTDDGRGFDAEAQPYGHGFLNMADRLGALGGSFALTSAPGSGTTLRGVIPAQPVIALAPPAAVRQA